MPVILTAACAVYWHEIWINRLQYRNTSEKITLLTCIICKGKYRYMDQIDMKYFKSFAFIGFQTVMEKIWLAFFHMEPFQWCDFLCWFSRWNVRHKKYYDFKMKATLLFDPWPGFTKKKCSHDKQCWRVQHFVSKQMFVLCWSLPEGTTLIGKSHVVTLKLAQHINSIMTKSVSYNTVGEEEGSYLCLPMQ